MDNQAPVEGNPNKKPWPVIIMIAMLAAVMLAGYILRPSTEQEKLRWLELLGTTNHGQLMNPPLEVEPVVLASAEGVPWQALDNATWKLVVVNQGACAEDCEELIYLARQVHLRLNKRAPLLERAWLNLGESGLNVAELTRAYPELALLQSEPSRYRTWIEGSNLQQVQGPAILLINPIDVAQLFYTPSHDGNGLLEDLEHLMKLAN